MPRSLPTLALAGVLVLAAAPAAFAGMGEASNDALVAPIVGGDSTTSALTGLVTNPEAYTIGSEHTTAGLNFIMDENSDSNAWVPTLLFGIEQRLEFGAWGAFMDGDDSDNSYGASLKFKFYDENTGTDIDIMEDKPGGGFPSIAAWYGLESNDSFMRHRFGLTGSWTFTEEDDVTGDEGSLNNTAVTAGLIYNMVDPDDNVTGFDENDFDWYLGANFVPGENWSVVVEYEDDDDQFQSDGFAGAVRYHLTHDGDDMDDDETTWVLQAGVQNTEDLLIGAQANF